MGVVTTAALATVGKRGLERLFDDLYDTVKEPVVTTVRQWRAAQTIKTLAKNLTALRQVKTIWQPERAIDLATFFTPPRVAARGSREPLDAIDLDVIADAHPTVIMGTIGQGKSILFRYLAAAELLRARRIPVFLELRLMKKDESLAAAIIRECRALGFEGFTEELLSALARNGRMALLLDGFDEVDTERRGDVIREIQEFGRAFGACPLLVSSRPGSGIEAAGTFRVLELQALEGNDYKRIIARVAEEKTALEIIAQIGNNAPILALLTTPLMVALLVVRYRVEQSIPSNFVSFFDGLFWLLAERHDQMKAGYRRERTSKLGNHELFETFKAVCFQVAKRHITDIRIGDLRTIADECLRKLGYVGKADAVVEDIISITCLIQQEGAECRFVHKSIQDYHSARYVSERPDAVAARFYGLVIGSWQKWLSELYFLRFLDVYKFEKYFALPDAMATLGVSSTAELRAWEPTEAWIRAAFDTERLREEPGRSKGAARLDLYRILSVGDSRGREFYRYTEAMNMGALLPVLEPISERWSEVKTSGKGRVVRAFDGGDSVFEVTFAELLDVPAVRSDVLDATQAIGHGIRRAALSMVERIELAESEFALDGI